MNKLLTVGVTTLFICLAFTPGITADETNFGNTLYVGGTGPGNYSKIQDAINDANSGDTVFVYTGTYKEEHIVINKGIKLLGEKKESTVVDGGQNNTVIIILADNVILTNFTIRGSGNGLDNNNTYEMDAGIRIKSNNVNVSNNIFKDNYIGICLNHSYNNTIIGNDFVSGGGSIYNLFSSHNKILQNRLNSTNGGIIQYETSHTIIHNNTLKNVLLFSIGLWNCSNDDVSYNEVTGNYSFGIIIVNSFQNCITYNNVSINDEEMRMYDSFRLDNSDNNTIRGNHIHDSRCNGMIFFSSSNKNTIIENKLSNNRMKGLVIAYSSGNHIEQNEIINTDGHSIYLHGDSKQNSIINNVISGYEEFTHSGYSGIKIEEKSSDNEIISNNITNHNLHGIDVYSHNNTIKSNVIDSNDHDGLHFRHSNDNLISKNIITKNNNGVYLEEISCNNHIEKNSITENIHHGIYIESLSEDNSIRSNNFIRNNENAYVESCGNVWRRNYWNRPRILPYRIPGTDRNEIDWFPRFFPINIPTIG